MNNQIRNCVEIKAASAALSLWMASATRPAEIVVSILARIIGPNHYVQVG